MKVFFTILFHFAVVLSLTVLTQVGGVVYLLSLLTVRYMRRRGQWSKPQWLVFPVFYLLALAVVPLLAPGRVPLPPRPNPSSPLKPATWVTALTFRNYVDPNLRDVLVSAAKEIQDTAPGYQMLYLDANFPFWNGFPLLPHLSHNDGKKVDIAFAYREKSNGKLFNRSLSWTGYGIVEGPLEGEPDLPSTCESRGNWQYNLLRKVTPQGKKNKLVFDQALNRDLIRALARDNRCGKIFIEPHLKARLGLEGYSKVRFHGCHAVRHDDHIHVQL